MKLMSRAEEFVLLSIWMLKENAYSLQIQKQLFEVTGKKWSLGTIYAPLERLEKKGYIESYLSDYTPERGGRHKRIYKLTANGKIALMEIKKMAESMWANIPGLSLEVE